MDRLQNKDTLFFISIFEVSVLKKYRFFDTLYCDTLKNYKRCKFFGYIWLNIIIEIFIITVPWQ